MSCGLANKGLTAIINFSIPVLMLLYPLTVVLILLSFLHPLFKGRQIVYVCTMSATFIIAVLDVWEALFGLSTGTKSTLIKYLPWYDIGLGWIVPALIAFIISLFFASFARKKAVI